MIRPEVAAFLARWQEVIFAAAIAGFGLWLAILGGYVLLPIGGAMVVLAASMAVLALRRVQFTRPTTAQGVVEVDEAQIGYYGPEDGGFISLQDMVELRLLRIAGRQMWRLKQSDGQALLIPLDAQGAAALFDAFAALPDMDTAALVAGLTGETAEIRPIWRRPLT